MKILQVIPANLKADDTITYSNFIESEILGLELIGLEVKKFFFVSRMSIKGLFKARNDLEKLIKSFDPDILHVHTGSTTTFVVALAKKRKIPWIITFGGSELLGNHKRGLKWQIRDTVSILLSKISAINCDGIICVSKNLQDALPFDSKKKSIIIPRGVDESVYKPIDKLEARKELDIKADEVIVLFSLNRKEAEVKNKVLADSIVQLVKEKNGISIRMISLIGYSQKEIVLLLNAADALLLTSLHEGSPNIVKEAMACNLPVVSVDCGDVKERLQNVVNSYVNPYDKKLLANSLVQVINQNRRTNGREEIKRQELLSSSICLRIANFYKKFLFN